MGLNNSRPSNDESTSIKPIRKQIGKRSSVNFLSRLDSRSASGQKQQPTYTVVESVTAAESVHDSSEESSSTFTPPTQNSSRQVSSDSATTLLSRDTTVIHHKSANSTDIVSSKSIASNKDTTAEEVETDEDANADHEIDEVQSEEESLSDPEDDIAEPTPVPESARSLAPLLPPPSMLERESPSKYGFDGVIESAREECASPSKRRTLTGPELFNAARNLQVSVQFVDVSAPDGDTVPASTLRNIAKRPHPLPPIPVESFPARVYYPVRSKHSPAELFHRTLQKPHAHSTPRKDIEGDPRTLRLLRRSYPVSLFRDISRGNANARSVAVALPLLPSQKNCPGAHAVWLESSNYMTPVECGICLCAGDCQSDTAVFWTCEACVLRICAECRSVFDANGAPALMRRYKDGQRTAEMRVHLPRGREDVSRRVGGGAGHAHRSRD